MNPRSVVVPSAVAAAAGWVALQGGVKGAAVGLVAAVTLATFAVVRERRLLLLAGLVLSLAVMLHKSIGPVATDVNGGAPSIYLTTLDLVLVVLYGLWLRDGTFSSDIATAFRRPLFWAPVAGGALTMASIVVARQPELGWAETFRMGWMLALFVYLAVRIRNRREVVVLLGALGAVALAESAVVALQWLTGSALGLGFLGVPDALGERVVNGGTLLRPFGTILHPVFMGAVMGPMAILALSLAIHLPRGRVRLAALAMVPVCAAPLVLANTRAALLGFAVAAVVLVGTSLAARRITAKTVATWAGVGVLIALPFTPQLAHVYRDSLQSEHFSVELDARLQLNGLALDMFSDKPLLGVGLNNFQKSIPHYDTHGLIFFGTNGREGHPVHNLFLLQLSESGLVGLAGLALVGVSLLVVGLRLARSADPLLGGIGAGVAAVYLFFLVEESLVFSLRQDQPLALYWILAGLSVACLRLSGWRPTLTTETAAPTAPPRPPARVRKPVAVPMAALLLSPLLTGFMPDSGPAAPAQTDGLKIVFAAVQRPGSHQAIYTVNADGTGVERITPDDGRDYSWPTWAMGGTKIVFTVRSGAAGSPENVALIDADGSNFTQLTFESWRHGQPKVSPDGTTVIFSAFWPEFATVAIYKLDLHTLGVTNLSARANTPGAVDGDPRWSADGSLIAFSTSAGADGTGSVPTQDWVMDPDGTGRRAITNDAYYNTDPALSPDGHEVAIASYRGEGNPAGSDPGDLFQNKSVDFRLVVKNLGSGAERELTRGASCFERVVPPDLPCAPADVSAYMPVWTPAGDGIGFVGALDSATVCICVLSPDGGHGRAVFASKQLAIRWFDWVRPGRPPATAVLHVGDRVPDSRLLFSGHGPDGAAMLAVSEPDRYGEVSIPIPAGLSDIADARLTPDGVHVIFTARTAGPVPAGEPHPAPPDGEQVHQHFTLDMLSPLTAQPLPGRGAGTVQVYRMGLDGKGLVRLTDAWLEDYMDAMAAGEGRSNDEPDLSPDGRYLVFRNLSSFTDESFILRLDTETGTVFSLTNATAGAVPTHDRSPRFSPDGRLVALSASVGAGTHQIVTVQAADGLGYRALTDDDYLNLYPAWSPDGREIAYVSYRGDGLLPGEIGPGEADSLPLSDWYLVKIDVATGRQTLLTDRLDSPAFSPAWSPDGRSIVFISVSPPGQPDLHAVPSDGGPALPVQVTLLTRESSVDWR